MKRILDIELEVVTNISSSELASKVEQAVREAIEAVKQSFGTELDFDVYLALNGHEVRFVMEVV